MAKMCKKVPKQQESSVLAFLVKVIGEYWLTKPVLVFDGKLRPSSLSWINSLANPLKRSNSIFLPITPKMDSSTKPVKRNKEGKTWPEPASIFSLGWMGGEAVYVTGDDCVLLYLYLQIQSTGKGCLENSYYAGALSNSMCWYWSKTRIEGVSW